MIVLIVLISFDSFVKHRLVQLLESRLPPFHTRHWRCSKSPHLPVVVAAAKPSATPVQEASRKPKCTQASAAGLVAIAGEATALPRTMT